MPPPVQRRRLPLSWSARQRIAGTILIVGTIVMVVGWIARLDLAGRELLVVGTALAIGAFGFARTPSMLLYLVLALAVGWFPVLIFRPFESLFAVGLGVGVAVWWYRQQEDDDEG